MSREKPNYGDWLDDMVEAARDLGAMMNAADDQAQAMTDKELGELLLSGRWTTIEIHEAGRRLVGGNTP